MNILMGIVGFFFGYFVTNKIIKYKRIVNIISIFTFVILFGSVFLINRQNVDIVNIYVLSIIFIYMIVTGLLFIKEKYIDKPSQKKIEETKDK